MIRRFLPVEPHVNDVSPLLMTAVLAALYFALGPTTGPIAFVLQMGGIGAAVGLVIALYRTERDRNSRCSYS